MTELKDGIRITYTKEGTSPPLFLAGTHSNWVAEEMQWHELTPGQYFFEKIIPQPHDNTPLQYKFRLGPGDWWVVDEEKPVVTDNAGNQNNLLVMTSSDQSLQNHSEQLNMSDQFIQHSKEESEGATSNSQKIPSMLTSEIEEDTDVSTASGMTGNADHPEDTPKPLLTGEVVPTLILEKTDNLPSYGEDFGPHATVAEKDARAMHAMDAKPDHVFVQSDTIREVFESPAELEKTLDLPVEEAGEFRQMSATPIPVVSETAAEVADTAAVLDREGSITPDLPDEEAGKIGLRRLSTTPIPVVSATAAEVADIAAMLDREESITPDLSDEEAGKIGLRRLSTTPIPVVSDTAAEVADVAAALDQETEDPDKVGKLGIRRLSIPSIPPVAEPGAGDTDVAAPVKKPTYIDIDHTNPWSPVGVDESIDYPETPEHERAPLLSHERWIPCPGVSPPKDLPARFMPLPETLEKERRLQEAAARGENSDSNKKNGPRNRPQPEPELIELPPDREAILAIFMEGLLRHPEYAIDPYDPDATGGSSSQQHTGTSSLSADHSPLDRIAEEDDSDAAEESEIASKDEDEPVPIPKDDGILSATQYARMSELVDQNTQAKQKNAQISGLVDKRDAETAHEQTLEAMGESSEQQKSEPVFVVSTHEETPKLDSSEKAAEKFQAECEQVDGHISSKPVTSAESTPDLFKNSDDGSVSDDTPETTPSASRDSHEHVSASDVPTVVVHSATPALSKEGSDFKIEKATTIGDEAEPPVHVSEIKSTPTSGEGETHTQVKDEDSMMTSTAAEEKDTTSADSDVNESAKDSSFQPVAEPAEAVSSKANEETIDTKSGTNAMPEEVKPYPQTPDAATTSSPEEAGTPAETATPDPTPATANTLTRRKFAGAASPSYESPIPELDGTAPLLHPAAEPHAPGLVIALYTAVIGWLGGFFAALCDGGRGEKKKQKQRKEEESQESAGGKKKKVGGEGGVKIV